MKCDPSDKLIGGGSFLSSLITDFMTSRSVTYVSITTDAEKGVTSMYSLSSLLAGFLLSLFASYDAIALTRYSPQYDQCIEQSRGTSVRVLECATVEHSLWDKRLNDAYARAMSRLDPSQKKNLRDEERAWIKDRDAKCSSKGGSADAKRDGLLCVLELTAQRTIELEALARGGVQERPLEPSRPPQIVSGGQEKLPPLNTQLPRDASGSLPDTLIGFWVKADPNNLALPAVKNACQDFNNGGAKIVFQKNFVYTQEYSNFYVRIAENPILKLYQSPNEINILVPNKKLAAAMSLYDGRNVNDIGTNIRVTRLSGTQADIRFENGNGYSIVKCSNLPTPMEIQNGMAAWNQRLATEKAEYEAFNNKAKCQWRMQNFPFSQCYSSCIDNQALYNMVDKNECSAKCQSADQRCRAILAQ